MMVALSIVETTSIYIQKEAAILLFPLRRLPWWVVGVKCQEALGPSGGVVHTSIFFRLLFDSLFVIK